MNKKHCEQIIIDGVKEECEILFECGSVDDLASYDMIKKNIKITPENAPVDDYDIRLIANPQSPYGFTSIFKRNKNVDEWEYMGFGHSGACSVVTALLKRLVRKTQEYNNLANILHATTIYPEICDRCKDEILIYPMISGKTSYTDHEVDLETLIAIVDRLKYKTQECEELKEKIKQVKDFKDKVINQLKEENEELKEYKAVVDELAGKQIILTNKDKMPELYENAKDLKLNSYLKALEEIERICVYLQERPIYAESIIRTYLKSIKIQDVFEDKILDIISKAKGEENAR